MAKPMQPSMTTCNQDSPKPASFIKKAYSGEDLAAAKLGPAWVFSLRFSNQPIDVLNHDIYLYIYINGSKHCLRRNLTIQIIPQLLPKKALGSIYVYIQ